MKRAYFLITTAVIAAALLGTATTPASAAEPHSRIESNHPAPAAATTIFETTGRADVVLHNRTTDTLKLSHLVDRDGLITNPPELGRDILIAPGARLRHDDPVSV